MPRLLARDALWAVGPGLVPFEERSRDGILNFGTLLGSSWEVEECLTRPWVLRCATKVVLKVFILLIGAIELVGRGRAGVFTAPLLVQERAPGCNLDTVSA